MSDESNINAVDPQIPGLDPSTPDAERDVMISAEEGDDQPVTVPDGMPRANERAMAGMDPEGESIEERLMQEEPDVDPHSGYGAQDAHGSGAALDQTILDADVDADEAQADLEGALDADLAGDSPEESALHEIDDPTA